MQLVIGRPSREFELQIRCENCMRESSRRVSVPGVDDAPADVDELIDSAFLANLKFCCLQCKGMIGRLVGASFCRGEV